MKRSDLTFILLLFPLFLFHASTWAQDITRPLIQVAPSDRQDILTKIETQEWAKSIYSEFIQGLDAGIELHQTDPEAFLREMPFDWEKSKPGETPPFTYTIHVANGVRTNLDNGTREEMANARKLIRFLQLGVDCGMAYYITEEGKYAQCATDILNAFVKGVLQMEQSEWRFRGGWLFPDDGFREVREIGARVPLIYDYVAEFIRQGGKAYDLGSKARIAFPQEECQLVFRTYANFTINYGHAGSNHAILEAPSLVYNALAMEEKNERNSLLSYFLTENTEYQDALPVMAANYKEEGDIWPETSQYLNHASTLLTRLMLVVNRYDPTLHLGSSYSNIMYSLPALDYLVYPNNQLIRWGDGHRYDKPSYSSYEDAYLLGKMDGVEKITSTFGPLINRALEEGDYKRRGMYAVLMHGGEIEGETSSLVLPRTDQVTHAGIFLQRNVSSTRNPDDGLMCFVGGAHMVHGHAEGMNIELYGEGQVLGVDNGRGRYQQDVHENYSRIFAAHNTVIVNGSSRGDSGWVNQGINTVKLISMEPMSWEEALSPFHSYSQTSFVDDRGDQAEANQERTLALVRTSPTTGYYVDVFRSKSKLPNEYHDYLYHNIGDSLTFKNEKLELSDTPERYMANANLPWEQNVRYRHPGWHFFKDVQTVSHYHRDVKALFSTEKLEGKGIYMNLFIPGFERRDYTRVIAPPTFEAPKPYNTLSTPTLVIRKHGEAWKNPFVVVYEPFSEAEKSGSIQEIEKLEQEGLYKGLKIVSHTGSEKLIQYVITQSGDEVYSDEHLDVFFRGSYAVITLDENEQLQNMYIGNGEMLRFGKTILNPATVQRAAYKDYSDRVLSLMEFSEMEATKEQITRNDKSSMEMYTDLIRRADQALELEPFSVMNKTGMPPSGDRHDYLSLAPYFWPNPDTPDGLPYIRKDGEINPETRDKTTDFEELQRFFNAVGLLGRAYYYSEDVAYAHKAIELIQAWFIDPETQMNPHLDYGQGIPGVNDGRPFGIIEFGGIRGVITCLELLENGQVLDPKTQLDVKAWLSAYAEWLQTSEIGMMEGTRTNNHGNWYDVQLCSILLYLDKKEEVAEILESAKQKRIAQQIEPDGSQPRELERTKSFSYSTMNLSALTTLAWFGLRMDVDLWNFETEEGRGIKKAYAFLIPYLDENNKWEYPQITKGSGHIDRFVNLLSRAGKTFNEESYLVLASEYRAKNEKTKEK